MSKDDITLLLPPVQAVVAYLQENQIAQISLYVVSIVCAIVELAYRIFKWWKEAKADGKIDKKEIEELVEIGEDAIEKTKDIIDKKGTSTNADKGTKRGD